MLSHTIQALKHLGSSLAEKYDIPVIAMSVESMRDSDVLNVLREALYEFPVLEVNVNLAKLGNGVKRESLAS